MKRQATGSISISTDGIAEAVTESVLAALRPHLPSLAPSTGTAPSPLTPEQAVTALTAACGSISALRVNPFGDHEIAVSLHRALLAAGYTLAPLPAAPEPDPDTSRSWFGRTSD